MGSACSSSRTSGSPPPPYRTTAGSNPVSNAGPDAGSNAVSNAGSNANHNETVNREPVAATSPVSLKQPTPKETLSPSEVIQQKAEEFWNEIKDIKLPDVTSGKTSDEIINDIIEHERIHHGIDWKYAVRSGEKELKKAIEKAHDYLKTIRSSFNDDDVNMAKSMGLLDQNGNIHHYDLLATDAASTSPGLAPIPGSAAPYVVWGWNKKETEKYQTATGGRVKDLIVNLIRNFQVMENDSTRYLVKTFMEAGLWGLGGYGLLAVWRIVRTLAALSEATEAYAVFEGVMTVGVNVIKLGISIVILAILVPLFIYMNKNAAAIMVIINDTNEDMRLIDLHTTHGKVVGIFKENAALDNPQPIIPKKLPPIINPKTHKVVAEGSIQAGFFAARKKDAALIGSQGALKFDQTSSYPKGVYIGWEVPLSQGKNCVLLSADYAGSTSDFSDKTNDDGKQDISVVSSKNARITAHVNSGSGSEGYYIISITSPATAQLAMIRTPREPTIEEKAATFWDSMKHIQLPDVTKGKTSDQVIDDIIDHENLFHGIDWRAAAKEGGRALMQASNKAHSRLRKIRKKMTPHEVKKAKAMGMLNANGDVPEYDLLGDAAVAEPNLAPIPSGAAPYVCWGWNTDHAAEFQNASGERIKNLITNMIRNFQVMNDDDERYLVKSFMEAGLWGLGLYGLKAVWKIIATLSELTEASTAYAVFTGIAEVGVNVIKLGISTVILAVLVPIFIYATKDAAACMVIINDTQEDLGLSEIYATHGKIVGIFKESAKLDNPQPIIEKKLPPIYNNKGKLVCKGSTQAGFLATRKHDNALVGTQGALKFAATTSYPQGISIGWEVPLSQGSNRLLVSTSFTGSASQFSDMTNDADKQEDSAVSSKNARVTGKVHSGSGSKGYYIFNITEPSQALQAESPKDKETLKKKAVDFLNEIKDIKVTDVTTGKTSDQVIKDIIEHEKTHNGIDWEAAAKGGKEEMQKAIQKAHEKLNDIRKQMTPKEVENAKGMGLLNENGEVHQYNILEDGKLGLAPMPGDASAFPVWAWDVATAAEYQNATGKKIEDLIVNLIRNFQVMEQSDTRYLTHLFMEIGLWGIGAYGLRAVWKILKTIEDMAAKALAIVDGIIEVGINVIKICISIVILAIFVPIFIYANKDAAALMVVINDTSDDLDLSEIHATHGKIIGVFKENADEKDPKTIIPKKLGQIVNQKGEVVASGSIQAGFFATRKNDSALVGTQGAFKFSPTSVYPSGVYVGWEVPLSQGSNRLLVSATYSGSVSEFSDMTNNKDKQEDSSVSGKNSKVTARVSSASGSKAYYVVNISDPPKPGLLGAVPSTSPPAEETPESVEEKSKKIWNEIKDIDIPNVTEGKSDDELLNDIMEHEKKEHGIDWKAAKEAGGDALDDAMKKAHSRLKSIREKMSKKDLHTAMSMGLLNSKGEVPEYDLMAKDFEEQPLLTAMAAGAETVHTVPIPSTAAPYMVWGWNAAKVEEFQGAAGGTIKTLVLQLIREFQAMKDDKTTTMTKAFTKAGLWGIGAVGLRAAWRILRAASAITEAVEAAAVADGIAVIGASVVTLGIATCILAVLVPLFIFMNKNAAAIMVIINDTDEDISMVDVHATHGKIVGIFKESADVDNPKPIIPKKLASIVDPKTKKVVLQGSVQAGFFAAKKRDNALYGTQGGMKFAPTTRFPQGVYVGWEIPLTMGSNRLLVSANFGGSASEFSNETNDHGLQEDHSYSSTHGQTSATVSGRVNSSSGSEGYYVINIQ